jgi:hypothetical protein
MSIVTFERVAEEYQQIHPYTKFLSYAQIKQLNSLTNYFSSLSMAVVVAVSMCRGSGVWYTSWRNTILNTSH